MRVLGPKWGIPVFILDTAKGTAAALLTTHPYGQIAVGLAAILGHVFSPWVRFKGGRGVATSLGVFLAILPSATLVVFGLWILLVLVSRRVSVGSVGAALAYPLLVMAFDAASPHRRLHLAAASLVALLIVVRHIPNLKRLASGSEPPTFGAKKAKP
jgi:glycerol-3-phosphate acyltransferase PlsY